MNWLYFNIGSDRDSARKFYAPDLDTAFHVARCNGFGSLTLHCFGAEAR